MVGTTSAVKEKSMEFVPETSMSSGEPTTINHRLKQARLSRFGVVNNKIRCPSQKAIVSVGKGKGKATIIDSQSESGSDFAEKIHRGTKSSTPRKKKRAGKNDKSRAVVVNRKRPRRPLYSDDGKRPRRPLYPELFTKLGGSRRPMYAFPKILSTGCGCVFGR